ncbi:alpha/beta hydrolase [Roseivivax halodurans JCM 10272]|uniref:Palmitoyl-protein thioesterase ABHD10, mitochondrial n=1 Tax=Roseivivax halodurans JCM 10272 TaxID=1449350 RepID=X7ELS7_9RHOB|nr:alpha/beta hydrolase [Roseivivax halodurans]ETX16136.1 alpha/beta hydrolase [Roseivivax halodurans JCM 10272]
MSEISILEGPGGRRLAYANTDGEGPCIVFLSGYKSDMEGTKAVHLEAWARSRGRAFLRLDYSGHGQSGGVFEEGAIGDWAEDAAAVIEAATEGPVVLVGSSMGGWIACILTRRLSRVAGFVGIAAAPDFTEDSFWAGFSDEQRRQVMEEGSHAMPSDYGDPYIVTRRLIEDGRDHLVLRTPLPMPFPVRLVQGTEDEAVAGDVPLRLLSHIGGDDVRLMLVKGADHRFSTPECLSLIERMIEEVSP